VSASPHTGESGGEEAVLKWEFVYSLEEIVRVVHSTSLKDRKQYSFAERGIKII
jgi:hypothetical protein